MDAHVAPEPLRRRAARVFLLNRRGQILLLRGSDPHRPEAGRWWFTPGGGTDEGEALEDAARRELFEEVGVTDVLLGPPLTTRVNRFTFQSVVYEQEETYFVGRIDEHEPDFSRFEAHEVASIDTWRWFSMDEVRESTDVIYPKDLAELLRAYGEAV